MTIYHNPRCRKSRETLKLIEDSGVPFQIVEYLKHPLSARELGDMLGMIDSKPDGVEVVFTGRYAPPELIAAADLVTEMMEVKHYYKQGVLAREGIER